MVIAIIDSWRDGLRVTNAITPSDRSDNDTCSNIKGTSSGILGKRFSLGP